MSYTHRELITTSQMLCIRFLRAFINISDNLITINVRAWLVNLDIFMSHSHWHQRSCHIIVCINDLCAWLSADKCRIRDRDHCTVHNKTLQISTLSIYLMAYSQLENWDVCRGKILFHIIPDPSLSLGIQIHVPPLPLNTWHLLA